MTAATVRVLPRFPVRVQGISALSATLQGGVLKIGIDPTNLEESADPTAAGNYTFILNSTTGEFELAEVASTVVDIATKSEAEAGTDNQAILSALRGAQAISVQAESAIYSPAGIGAYSRTIGGRLRDDMTSFDFIPPAYHAGIKAGTYTDDVAPYIQKAFVASDAESASLRLIGGHHYLRSQIDATDKAFQARGDGYEEGPLPATGTWFIHAEPSIIPFKFSGVIARGFTLEKCGLHQNHPDPAPGWAPANFDWLFDCADLYGASYFRDLYFTSIRKAFRTRNSGRVNLHGMKGQVFECLADIDRCLHVSTFKDINMWTHWVADANVLAWQQAYGDVFRSARNDTPFFEGEMFALGYRSFIRFTDLGNGTTTRAHVGDIQGDAVKHTVWGDGTANGVTGTFGAIDSFGEDYSNIGTALPGSNAIQFDNKANIQVAVLRAELIGQSAVRLLSDGGSVANIGQSRVTNFNLDADGSAAFHAADATTAPANVIILGTTPQIDMPPGWSMFNSGTNALLVRPAAPNIGTDGILYSYDTGADRTVETMVGPDATISNYRSTKGAASTHLRDINGAVREILQADADANTLIELIAKLGFFAIIPEGEDDDIGLFLSGKGAGENYIGAAGQKLGFLGSAPVLRPAVTGSRGGNAALASLITALSTLGLLSDSSTV